MIARRARAWQRRTGSAHEQPSRRLAGLCRMIASLRGGAIECRGSVDLVWHAAEPHRRRILQADEVVWLYPGRARIPDAGLDLDAHDRPDVVLEVDHTTDVRRGKRDLYAEWGFPEVWVYVPDVTPPARPAGRAPGLTIHRLHGGRYRTVAASPAFAGWTAAEIHAALNEPEPSPATDRVLDRIAQALGARELFGRPGAAVLRAPALLLQIDQQWNMFSPEPARWSRFLVARGETAGGRSVDLLVDGQPRGAGAAMSPPSGRFGRDRWRAYFGYLRRLPADARERLGNAAQDGDDRLARVRLYRVSAPIGLASDPEPSGRSPRVRELLTVAVGTPR